MLNRDAEADVALALPSLGSICRTIPGREGVGGRGQNLLHSVRGSPFFWVCATLRSRAPTKVGVFTTAVRRRA